MSLFAYIAVMTISTVFSWAAWILVITVVNPATTDWFGIFLFYAAMGSSLTGSFALIGFFLRSLFFRSSDIRSRVWNSFRQGLFFALLIDGFLVMQHAKLLTWYNAAFLIIALTLLEFFSISRRTVKI